MVATIVVAVSLLVAWRYSDGLVAFYGDVVEPPARYYHRQLLDFLLGRNR